MADEEESFKVTDRRGLQREFTESPVLAPAQAPAPPLPPRDPAPSSTGRTGADQARQPAGEGDLSGLFIMFASSGLIGLGAAPDPMTGQPRLDLEQAQEAIETLLLLRTKTEGNRTEEESRLLEDILYDLQMRFVQAKRRGGRPA